MKTFFPVGGVHCSGRSGKGALAFVCALLLFRPGDAAAQVSSEGEWRRPFEVRRSDEETGFRLGPGRIHGVLGVGILSDSNVFFGRENPRSDFAVSLVPGADFSLKTRKLSGKSGYRFSFRDYFSTNEQDSREHRGFVHLQYQVNRRFHLWVSDTLEKTSSPADVELPERLGSLRNDARVAVVYKTPGEDLDIGVRYVNQYTSYDASLLGLSYYANKVALTSRVNVSSHFRFLPKSVVAGSIEYGQTNWAESSLPGESNSDSKGFSVNSRLTSNFSRKLALSLGMGLTFIYFDEGPHAGSIDGVFEAYYNPARELRFSFSYQRITEISTFTNFNRQHRFEIKGRALLGRKVEAIAHTRLYLMSFSGPVLTLRGYEREDLVLSQHAGVSYSLNKWVTLKADYRMDYRDSNTTDPITGGYSADFIRHTGELGAEFYY